MKWIIFQGDSAFFFLSFPLIATIDTYILYNSPCFPVSVIYHKFTHVSCSIHSFAYDSVFIILPINTCVFLPGAGNHFLHMDIFPEWLPCL